MDRLKLTRLGLTVEFIAEFLYFMEIITPNSLPSTIVVLAILLLSVLSSALLLIGFATSRLGTLGSVLNAVGAVLTSLCLLPRFHSINILVLVGPYLLFLGDLSISAYLWRVGDFRVRVSAIINALPVVTFVGSLLLALFLYRAVDAGEVVHGVDVD